VPSLPAREGRVASPNPVYANPVERWSRTNLRRTATELQLTGGPPSVTRSSDSGSTFGCSPRDSCPTSTHSVKRAGGIWRPLIAIADVPVVVSNAKASAKWWKDKLGFSSYTVGGSGHAILVAPPGDRFVLHLCEGFAPLEPGDTGIAFVTDELRVLATRMKRAGVKFPEPPGGDNRGRMAKFADPDGNVFWIIQVPLPFVRATLNSRAPKGQLPPPKAGSKSAVSRRRSKVAR
jgi:hypothetical protein